MMRPLPLAACLALVSALPFTTVAQDAAQPPAEAAAIPPAPAAEAAPAPAALTGNPEAGRQLAYTCQGCHGITGYKNAYPSFKVPLIGGQSAEYLAQALRHCYAARFETEHD